jgi:pimeloyl-ACP methyl ester carboxylesterase
MLDLITPRRETMYRHYTLVAFLSIAALPAQTTELAGRALNPLNPEEVRSMGLLMGILTTRAQASGRVTPEVLKIRQAAMQAVGKQDWHTGYRLGMRYVFALQGTPWTEAEEVQCSFNVQLPRFLFQPGEPVEVALVPAFEPGTPLQHAYTAELRIGGKPSGKWQRVRLERFETQRVTIPTKGLPPGAYAVEYRLSDARKQPLLDFKRKFEILPELDARLAKLEAAVATDASRLTVRQKIALESVEYLAKTLKRARSEYFASLGSSIKPISIRIAGLNFEDFYSEPYQAGPDLAQAEAFVKALEANTDPFEGRSGDFRLAYRSAVDQTLQPYRLLLPKTGRLPLIVALHGATNDENTFLDRFGRNAKGEPLFKKLAQERGYALVSPNGRGPFGGYQGNSEKDVLDVLERALTVVNATEVFLTGHSMGAGGTINLGFKHAARFKALAAIAAGALTATVMQKQPAMPLLLCHGAKDELIPLANAQRAAEAGKKELKTFEYFEDPNADHFSIGVTAAPKVFDFFDRFRTK